MPTTASLPEAFPMNQEACLHLFCTDPRRSAIKPAYRPCLASAQRSAKEPPASNTHVEAADTKHAPRYPRRWCVRSQCSFRKP